MALPLAAIVALAGPVLVVDQSAARAAADASLRTDLDVCPFSVGFAIGRQVAVADAIVGAITGDSNSEA